MNPYLILPLLSLFLNGSLGYIVYRRNPEGKANRLFLLFISAIMWWNLAVIVFKGTSFYPETFSRLVFLGIVPLPSIFLHFTFAFPRLKPVSRRMKGVLYAPAIFFVLLLFTDHLVSGIRETRWGPTVLTGDAGLPLFIYFTLYTGAAYFNLWGSFRDAASERVRHQVLYLAMGTGIFFVAGNAVYVGNLILGLDIPPLAEVTSIVMAGFMTCAILKEDILEIEAGMEPLAPFKKPPLKKGMVYFAGSEAYSLFADTVTSPCSPCPVEGFPCESQDCWSCHIRCPCNFCDRDRIKGVFVTPRDPAEVRKECGLEVTPGFQLQPDTNMDSILWVVREFTHLNSPSVVLFELDSDRSRNMEEAERLVLQLVKETNEDSILVVSLCPDRRLEPLMGVLAGELQDVMISSLTNPIMREILEFVGQRGKASFTNIQEELGISLPSRLSYYIGNLKEARMLFQDSQRLYRLTGPGMMAVRALKKMEADYIDEITLAP